LSTIGDGTVFHPKGKLSGQITMLYISVEGVPA
jgi:hypothetical protein